MPTAALKNFARQATHLHPDLKEVFSANAENTTKSPLQNHADPPESPDWCYCGQCRPTPTQEEYLCCRRRLGPCTTIMNADHIEQVVLNRNVLIVAL